MDKRKTILISFLAVSICLAGFLVIQSKKAQANADENVSGWAWIGNNVTGEINPVFGWISFNSSNCDSDDNGITDQGNFSECPDGEGSVDYGVHIDPVTGIFSGKAWSEYIGWVSFDSADLVGCPSGVCRAEMDLGNGEVSGWIRALSPVSDPEAGGWDGWIKMRGSNYGVYYDASGPAPTLNGWAWGGGGSSLGNAVVGWISFNDDNYDQDDDDLVDPVPPAPPGGPLPGAPIPDYDPVIPPGLVNTPPTVDGLARTPLGFCTVPLEEFVWNFHDVEDGDGINQTAYQLQVKTAGLAWAGWTAGSGEFDSGQQTAGTQSASIQVNVAPTANKLTYGQNYDWRVMVWDSGGLPSDWEYGEYGASFSTPIHQYPEPSFTSFPAFVTKDEWVEFSDASICYGTCNYQWDFDYNSGDGFLPDYFESTNASSTYNSFGAYTVRLRLTDTILAEYCVFDKNVIIGPRLPNWQEVAP